MSCSAFEDESLVLARWMARISIETDLTLTKTAANKTIGLTVNAKRRTTYALLPTDQFDQAPPR